MTTEMAEAFVNDKGEWDYRPLANPPEYLTAVVKINYDVADIIAFLEECDDPDEVAKHGKRLYTLDDVVQVVQDLASEDIASVSGFYIETDDGKVVG